MTELTWTIFIIGLIVGGILSRRYFKRKSIRFQNISLLYSVTFGDILKFEPHNKKFNTYSTSYYKMIRPDRDGWMMRKVRPSLKIGEKWIIGEIIFIHEDSELLKSGKFKLWPIKGHSWNRRENDL